MPVNSTDGELKSKDRIYNGNPLSELIQKLVQLRARGLKIWLANYRETSKAPYVA